MAGKLNPPTRPKSEAKAAPLTPAIAADRQKTSTSETLVLAPSVDSATGASARPRSSRPSRLRSTRTTTSVPASASASRT